MAAKGNRLQSITVEKVIQDAYSTSSLKLSTMWNALKHSEAIKYAGMCVRTYVQSHMVCHMVTLWFAGMVCRYAASVRARVIK